MRIFISSLLTALGISFAAQANTVFDTTNVPQTFSQLGGTATCNANNTGARATITDGPAAPSWGTSVTTGGGPSTVALYCNGKGWQIYAAAAPAGGGSVSPAVLAAPTTNQGNYATGCAGGSCLTFDDHWTSPTLNAAAWYAGLYINAQYINGGIGLTFPFSAWTVDNSNGGTNTVFFDYPYGYGTNTASVNFSPLSKASDGSLQLGFGPNSYVGGFNSLAFYAGSAISSFYSPATEIMHTGGLLQFRVKFDKGLQYGSYPGMQCSSGTNGVSGTSYNSNFEWGYTWTGTPLTNIGMSMNNVGASTGNDGATSSTGVYQVPSTNDWTNWHTVAVEYTGDTGTKKWQWYVDGTLINSVAANHPTGTDFNCSFQIFNANTTETFHSQISSTNPPPFYAWISDWQFYKKPGT